MDSKKTGEDKDHLAPTNIEQEHTSDTNKRPDANLSHEELLERLDNYSTVNRDEKPVFSILALKQKYLKDIEAKNANRNKGAIHYSQGRQSGLPQSDYEDIKDNHDQEDLKSRNNRLNEAKEKYRATNSLEKIFKEKDNDLDK